MTRVITTLVGIPILVYIILYAPIAIFIGVGFIAMLLALHEYFHLTGHGGFHPVYLGGYSVASVIYFAFYHPELDMILPVAAALILLLAVFTRLSVEHGLSVTGYAVFGAIYLGGLMGFLVGLRLMEEGEHLVMMLFVIIWASDIFAYLVGRQWGRHKLTSISPNKTVEGAVAGLIASVLTGFAYSYFFLLEISWMHAVILGGLVGIMGQIGDVCESLLKRSANVKDSGTLLPGHGGVLDRVDSLLFGAPTMYYYLYFFLYS